MLSSGAIKEVNGLRGVDAGDQQARLEILLLDHLHFIALQHWLAIQLCSISRSETVLGWSPDSTTSTTRAST